MNGRAAMRCPAQAGAIAAVLALSLILAACSAPVPTDSGVRGTVRIGPTTPVQQQGEPSDAPYAADLAVRSAAGTVVARTRSGADGTFTIALAPGDYTIEGAGGSGTPPTPPPARQFTVRPHEFTVVDLAYDSGIR